MPLNVVVFIFSACVFQKKVWSKGPSQPNYSRTTAMTYFKFVLLISTVYSMSLFAEPEAQLTEITITPIKSWIKKAVGFSAPRPFVESELKKPWDPLEGPHGL